jgi:chemotaxis protein MotB
MAVIRKLNPAPPEHETPKSKLRKKSSKGEHDESNWLISYADMMTLLCVFYIMLFSMSKVNTPEFEKVKKEVAEHFGTKYESPTEDLGKFVSQIINETGVAKDVTITSDGVSVSLAFHSTLFFDSMSAEISNEGKLILDRIINSLREQQTRVNKEYKFVVEGHTDSQPVLGGPFPSNWELSSARATRVIRLFLEDGFKASNLLAIGYADTQPVSESRNPDGSWNAESLAKNRRVVVRVLLPEVDSIPWKMKGPSDPALVKSGPVPASVPEVPAPAAAAPALAVPGAEPAAK